MTAFHDSTDFVNRSEVEEPTVEVSHWAHNFSERFGVEVFPSMEGGVLFEYRNLEVKILNTGEITVLSAFEDREYSCGGSSFDDLAELLEHLGSPSR